MWRCWIMAGIVVAIFMGIRASARIAANQMEQTGSTRIQTATLSDSVSSEAERNGAAASQSAQNNSAQKQDAQSATGQDGNAANGTAQSGSSQEQAKTENADESSFLIARRELNDPLFEKAVILMLPLVDTDGAVGLIVNRPTKITLHELFPKIAAYKDGTAVAYFGGPVDVKTGGVLFRSTKAYKEAFHLTGDLYVSFNSDLIEKVLKKPKEVTDVRLFLGRSQWGNKQLAAEMERGSWFGEKEANSVIFRRDSANVWIELIGALEPGSLAEERGSIGNAVRNVAVHREVVCAAHTALYEQHTVTQRSRAGLLACAAPNGAGSFMTMRSGAGVLKKTGRRIE